MKNYCLITGASSGLGAEFARELSESYNLILVARREERLLTLKEELKNTECIIRTCDLSLKENIYSLYESVKDYPIEMVINNAGLGETGSFLETDEKKELRMIDTNITAVYLLLKLFLKKMKEDNISGKILNVASIAGILRCGPFMSQYYATKSYVVSLTLGVREELREAKSPIYVGALCPGPVDTEFNQVANSKFSLKGVTSEYCVSYAIKKMKKRKSIILPSFKIRMAAFFSRFLSYGLLARATAKQQKKKIYKEN